MFRTTISGSLSKCYESVTWEEAEDKHRRVLEKIRTTLRREDGQWNVESEYERIPYPSRTEAIAAAVHRAMELGALFMISEFEGKMSAPVDFAQRDMT
nr:hypothetical protein [uncultured Cupriavidus sp.]